MSLNTEQKSYLAAPLSRAHVKSRSQAGRQLSYIESWHAIAEANRIFDFDGWSSETVDIKCVHEGEREIGQQKRAGWAVSYTAKVRVTVAGVVREGIGAGHGIDVDKGLAHESAIKEAESDARKRCLMTFGNPFGLALYDKTQSEAVDEPKTPKPETTPAATRTVEQWRKACEGWREQIKRAASVTELNNLQQQLTETGELDALKAYNADTYEFFMSENNDVTQRGLFYKRRDVLAAVATSRQGAMLRAG